ncbi:MAG: FecR domain-containing protein [Cyclobacteriaceae bacterium]
MNRPIQSKQFFKGELKPEEAKEFLKWLHSEQSEEDLATEFDRLWFEEMKSRVDNEWSSDEVFDQITKLKENQVSITGTPLTVYSSSQVTNRYMYRISAVIGLIIVSVWVLSLFIDSSESSKLTDHIIEKVNPPGQKSRLTLPDGSIVHLNADSRIQFQGTFSTKREVVLEGEAFFEVFEDPSRPFVVRCGRLSTTALGTSFNIRSFKNSTKVEVTLATGTVRVDDELSHKSVLLDPFEQVVLENGNAELIKNTLSSLDLIEWKDGVINFDKVPFSEVINELERWYGVEIQLHGKMKNARCSGTFKDEYLSNILAVLSHTMDFQYTIHEKQVEINFNPKQ